MQGQFDWVVFVCLSVLRQGLTMYVIQAGMEFEILLSLSPECWDYSCTPTPGLRGYFKSGGMSEMDQKLWGPRKLLSGPLFSSNTLCNNRQMFLTFQYDSQLLKSPFSMSLFDILQSHFPQSLHTPVYSSSLRCTLGPSGYF
jgi:hypothetical protein